MKTQKDKNMEWYSWTSPIGIGLFVLILSASFYAFSQAVYTLTKTGKTGKEIEKMEKG